MTHTDAWWSTFNRPDPPLWLAQAPGDRRAVDRCQAEVLQEHLRDSQARVMDVCGSEVWCSTAGVPVWRTVTEGDSFDASCLVWAGHTEGLAGRWVRVHSERPAELEVGGVWTPWRVVAAEACPEDAAAMAAGVSLARWHRLHPFCSQCGGPSVVTAGGWMRICPGCGAEHYPRTDPVVIMAVMDEDDRLCLSRGHRWSTPTGMSCPAGFVDAGESLEDAVRREVHEELGLMVHSVTYAGSQPWPGAGQLMVAMAAWVQDPELTLDPSEVADARWFTRAELHYALDTGTVTLPARYAAGRWLVERWLGEPLPDAVTSVFREQGRPAPP